jgi:hypothetical protein
VGRAAAGPIPRSGGRSLLATTCEFVIDIADSRNDALDLALRDSIVLCLGVTFRGIGAGRDDTPLSLSRASIVELAGVLEREGSTSVVTKSFRIGRPLACRRGRGTRTDRCGRWGDRRWGKYLFRVNACGNRARASGFPRLLNKKLLEEETEVEPELFQQLQCQLSIATVGNRYNGPFCSGYT